MSTFSWSEATCSKQSNAVAAAATAGVDRGSMVKVDAMLQSRSECDGSRSAVGVRRLRWKDCGETAQHLAAAQSGIADCSRESKVAHPDGVELSTPSCLENSIWEVSSDSALPVPSLSSLTSDALRGLVSGSENKGKSAGTEEMECVRESTRLESGSSATALDCMGDCDSVERCCAVCDADRRSEG